MIKLEVVGTVTCDKCGDFIQHTEDVDLYMGHRFTLDEVMANTFDLAEHEKWEIKDLHDETFCKKCKRKGNENV